MADQPLTVFYEGILSYKKEQEMVKQHFSSPRVNLLDTSRLDGIRQVCHKNARNDVILGGKNEPIHRSVYELAPYTHQNGWKPTLALASKKDDKANHVVWSSKWGATQTQTSQVVMSRGGGRRLGLSLEDIPVLKEEFINYFRCFLCAKHFRANDIVSKMHDILSIDFLQRNEHCNENEKNEKRHITLDIKHFDPKTGRFEVQFTSSTFGQAATIFISLYRMWGSDNTFVVECTRGNGDSQTYHEFLKEFTFFCDENKLVKYTDIPFPNCFSTSQQQKNDALTFGAVPQLSLLAE